MRRRPLLGASLGQEPAHLAQRHRVGGGDTMMEKECPTCEGQKWISYISSIEPDEPHDDIEAECPVCKGTGVINED